MDRPRLKLKRAAPTKAGRYKVEGVLGQGTYGKVYLGVDTQTNKKVALKVFEHKRLRSIKGAESKVHSEIAILKRLDHIHIVSLEDEFQVDQDQALYVAMELITGGTLHNLVYSSPLGRLSIAESRWYFKQLIEGLRYLHSQGIVHRDIKPHNLMITADHILKIVDFGSAEVLDLRRNNGASCSGDTWVHYGSPAFFSPEIASGNRMVSGFSADVWAAGVTLYVMICGQPPFSGASLELLLNNICESKFDLPEHVPADVRDLLTSILNPNNRARLMLDEILAHPFLRTEFSSDSNSPHALSMPEFTPLPDFDNEIEPCSPLSSHSPSLLPVEASSAPTPLEISATGNISLNPSILVPAPGTISLFAPPQAPPSTTRRSGGEIAEPVEGPSSLRHPDIIDTAVGDSSIQNDIDAALDELAANLHSKRSETESPMPSESNDLTPNTPQGLTATNSTPSLRGGMSGLRRSKHRSSSRVQSGEREPSVSTDDEDTRSETSDKDTSASQNQYSRSFPSFDGSNFAHSKLNPPAGASTRSYPHRNVPSIGTSTGRSFHQSLHLDPQAVIPEDGGHSRKEGSCSIL